MIEKISKILALAQGASTEAEAEACFAKAQALASAHAISLAEARMLGENATVRETPQHKTLTIGAPRKRANKHLVLLMSAIADVNDVKMNIAHNSTYVILFGFPSDIQTCETMWIQISHQMVTHAERYLASDAWRQPELDPMYDLGYAATRTPTKQTARSSYYQGFVASLAGRLRSVRAAQVAKAEEWAREKAEGAAAQQGDGPQSTTTAVALRAKEGEVNDYYNQHSNARGSWGGASRPTRQSASARAAGQRAAHLVRLTDDPEVSGRRGAISAHAG